MSDFARAYPISLGSRCALNPERCFFGEAPTLAAMRKVYGVQAVRQWLGFSIVDLVVASGGTSESKTDRTHVHSLARTIESEWPWLNAAEILLFFHRYKTARYGTFYGSFNPISVCDGLRKFIRERAEAYAQRQKDIDAAERDAWHRERVTYEEYLLLKQQQNEKLITETSH